MKSPSDLVMDDRYSRIACLSGRKHALWRTGRPSMATFTCRQWAEAFRRGWEEMTNDLVGGLQVFAYDVNRENAELRDLQPSASTPGPKPEGVPVAA